MPFNLIVDNIGPDVMLTSIVEKIKVIPSYFYRNYAAPRIYSFRDRKILSKNLELKNKYVGRRCFIVGAGPSIDNIDLPRLNSEYTFVVNEFDKNNQYRLLAPKFHIIADNYSEGIPEYWLERFKAKDRNIPQKTTIITGIGAIPIVNKYGLFKKHRIYYVGTQGIFSNNIPFNINLDRYVPNPKNSILMCVMVAVWMGFNEIYLLGCEHNFLAQPFGKNKTLSFSHSRNYYDVELMGLENGSDEILKKYLRPKEMSANYENNIANTLQLFKNYRLFYAKARQTYPDLKIFNATPNSFLDVFPVINFEDIKL